MKLANSPTAKNERRIKALSRLEYDLSKVDATSIAITKRINNEMKALVGKIIDPTSARASRSKIHRGPK